METKFRSELKVINFGQLKTGDFFKKTNSDDIFLRIDHDRLGHIGLNDGKLARLSDLVEVIRVKPINLDFKFATIDRHLGDFYAFNDVPVFISHRILQPGNLYIQLSDLTNDSVKLTPLIKTDSDNVKGINFNGFCNSWQGTVIELVYKEPLVFVAM